MTQATAPPLTQGQTYRRQYLKNLSDNEARLKAFYKRLMDALWLAFLSFTDRSGLIPQANRVALRVAVYNAIMQAFLGATKNPYDDSSGVLLAKSEFMRVIIPALQSMAATAVAEQAAILKNSNTDTGSSRRTIAATRGVLTDYQPPLKQVLPDGKSFAERLPWVAQQTYQRLWYYALDSLDADNTTASVMGKLTQWMNPHGEYLGRRLARSEALRAYTHIGLTAAELNSAVDGFGVRTSPQHRDTDDCDHVEAGSPYPLRASENAPPLHPLCMCEIYWIQGYHKVPDGVLTPAETQVLTQLLLVG